MPAQPTNDRNIQDIWPTVKEKQEGVITRNRVLNPGQPEGKVFREIEIGLEGIKFRAGDVCGVVPINDPKQVDRLLQVLGVDAAQKVRFGSEEITAGELFRNKIEIVHASEAFLRMLDKQHKEHKLSGKDMHLIERALGDKAVISGLANHAIADLIEHFGIEGVSVEDLTNPSHHRRLGPRLYTLSSATDAHPNAVHMTVARVDYQLPLGNKEISKQGVCTGYMDTLQEGQNATFFLQAKKGFRLPEVLDKPIVMIGPGTGIAPFRAFVQEIEAGGKPHKDIVLYSGGQYEVDALYRKEFDHAHEKQVLTEAPHYAISREGKKQRVQQLLKQDAEHIRQLANDGAIFYICGGEKMGEEVVATLKEIAPELEKRAKEQIKMDVY